MVHDREAARRILARIEAGERIGVTIGDWPRPAEIAIIGAFAAFVRDVVAQNLRAIIDGNPPEGPPPGSEPASAAMTNPQEDQDHA